MITAPATMRYLLILLLAPAIVGCQAGLSAKAQPEQALEKPVYWHCTAAGSRARAEGGEPWDCRETESPKPDKEPGKG